MRNPNQPPIPIELQRNIQPIIIIITLSICDFQRRRDVVVVCILCTNRIPLYFNRESKAVRISMAKLCLRTGIMREEWVNFRGPCYLRPVSQWVLCVDTFFARMHVLVNCCGCVLPHRLTLQLRWFLRPGQLNAWIRWQFQSWTMGRCYAWGCGWCWWWWWLLSGGKYSAKVCGNLNFNNFFSAEVLCRLNVLGLVDLTCLSWANIKDKIFRSCRRIEKRGENV